MLLFTMSLTKPGLEFEVHSISKLIDRLFMTAHLATCEEIADIVFNSADSDLNDLLGRIIKARKYNIQQLFLKIVVSINSSLPYNVRMGTTTAGERPILLEEKIRLDLTYYAIHSELSTEPVF